MSIRSRLSGWLSHPVLQIIFLGTGSWIIYLHLTLAYPLTTFVLKYPLTDFGRANNWNVYTLWDFCGSIAGAFLLYFLAYRVARRYPNRQVVLWLTFGFAVLYAVTLLDIYPITATDIFEYSFHSRILTRYGQNPLTTAPIAFKGDPFLKTVNWAVQPSPYGPLWVILTVPGSLFAANDLVLNLLMMKALPVIFYLGCLLTVGAILRRLDPGRKLAGMVLFGWNPLILFEAIANGHNGIIMMFFVLFAVYLMVSRRWTLVLPVIVASVLVKYVSALLILPFLLYCWRAQANKGERIAYLVRTLTISGLLFAILELPFLAVPAGLLDEANFYSLLAVPTLVYHHLKSAYGDKMAKTLTLTYSSVVYIGIYMLSLRIFRRMQRPQTCVLLGTWFFIVYLIIGSMHFQPWFAVWPITLGIWINHPLTRRVLFAFTLSALFSYAANFFWIWNYRAWSSYQANEMFVLVIFAPPLIVGLASAIGDYTLSVVKHRSMLEMKQA